MFPEYVKALIENAKQLRFGTKSSEKDQGVVAVTEGWWNLLNEHPYMTVSLNSILKVTVT